MIHLGDITTIHGGFIEPVDCISFGSPCQDLSVAGKRAGLDGERSGLFMEAVRIIKEMREHDRQSGRSDDIIRPRYAIWENVPGAFSSAGGEDFLAVLEELVHVADPDATIPRPDKKWLKSGCIIGDGYSLAWRTMDAQYWGVPQRRKRITLLCDFQGWTAPDILFTEYFGITDSEEGQPFAMGAAGRRTREVLFKREGMPGNTEQSIKTWKGIATDPERSARKCNTLKIRSGCDGGGKGPLIQNDMSSTLATHQDQTLF